MVMLSALLGGDVNALALVLLLLPRDWGDDIIVLRRLPFVDLGVLGELVRIVAVGVAAAIAVVNAIAVVDAAVSSTTFLSFPPPSRLFLAKDTCSNFFARPFFSSSSSSSSSDNERNGTTFRDLGVDLIFTVEAVDVIEFVSAAVVFIVALL